MFTPLPVFLYFQVSSVWMMQFALWPVSFWKKLVGGLGLQVAFLSVLVAYQGSTSPPEFMCAVIAAVLFVVSVVSAIGMHIDYVRHHDMGKHASYQSLSGELQRFKQHTGFMFTYLLVGLLTVAVMVLCAIRTAVSLKDATITVVSEGAQFDYCVMDSVIVYVALLNWIAFLRLNAFCMDTVMAVSDVQSLAATRERLPLLATPPGGANPPEDLPPIRKQDLREGKLIGQGAYGAVYSCKVVSGPRRGARYAVKKLMLRGTSPSVRAELVRALEREIDLLQALCDAGRRDHDVGSDRLVSYIGAIVEPEVFIYWCQGDGVHT
jgi:hypothetical protein